MAFSQAVSGLNAAATNLDVLATISPTLPPTALNQARPLFRYVCRFESGTGGKSCWYHSDFTDGTTTNTGRGLDVAISQTVFSVW